MPRILENGTRFVSVRFTPEEAAAVLLASLDPAVLADAMPDFGEGEGDSIALEVRPDDSNATTVAVGEGFEVCIILKDVENDPVVEPALG